jgi:hypothetical protein
MSAKSFKKLPSSSPLKKDKNLQTLTSLIPSPRPPEIKSSKSKLLPLAPSKSGKESLYPSKNLKKPQAPSENPSGPFRKFATKKNDKEVTPSKTPLKSKLSSST